MTNWDESVAQAVSEDNNKVVVAGVQGNTELDKKLAELLELKLSFVEGLNKRGANAQKVLAIRFGALGKSDEVAITELYPILEDIFQGKTEKVAVLLDEAFALSGDKSSEKYELTAFAVEVFNEAFPKEGGKL